MNVAVFADVHGRLLLCLKICARWQRETGRKLDLILQAGDLGAFPDTERLDRATQNHARHDPTELGFARHFTKKDAQVEAVLAELDCNMVFVRGNHEDQNWLDELEEKSDPDLAIFPIDYYQRIFCLKTGVIYQHKTANDEVLNVLGVGRVGRRENSDRPENIYIQPYESKRLFSHKRSTQVDVLLTHDLAQFDNSRPNPPELDGYKSGMPEIRQALNYYEPTYYFFGHVGHKALQYQDSNGVSAAYKLADLSWSRDSQQRLGSQSLGILKWENQQEHSFEIFDVSWLSDYTIFNWEYL